MKEIVMHGIYSEISYTQGLLKGNVWLEIEKRLMIIMI